MYTRPGVYTVTLVATDSTGLQTYLQLDSIVLRGRTCGRIHVAAEYRMQQYTGVTYRHIAECHNLELGFGDGTTSNMQSPSHIYTELPVEFLSSHKRYRIQWDARRVFHPVSSQIRLPPIIRTVKTKFAEWIRYTL